MMKYFLKLGVTNVGAKIIDFLISSNGFFPSRFHLKTSFSLIIFIMSWVSSPKSSTKAQRKLTWPKKDLTPTLFTGRLNCWIAFTLLGSIWIPLFDTICPSNFPSTNKTNFLGFRDIPCSLHLYSIVNKSLKWYFIFLENTIKSSR